jgi:sulfoxide reductase catalytic subunit YedY
MVTPMIYPRLVKLHSLNGWNLLFLFVTGILLYIPELRGPLAPIRVPMKWLHIGSGLLSVGLLLLYLPHVRWHWEKLRSRVGQKINVVLLGSLLVGWLVTGIILWFNRYMPQDWAETALIWHDRFTWYAMPWVAAHALTRYFKWKIVRVTDPVMEDRRTVLAGAATIIGVLFWRGLGQRLELPGFERTVRAEGPGPFALGHEPIPEGHTFNPPSVGDCPVHEGSRGRFRVYSVTPQFPNADPSTWTMRVSGLVDRPQTFTWKQFQELPRTCDVSNFHCVTGWSVYDCKWEGVRLRDLLDTVGVQPEAKFVKFYSADGVYTDAVDLTVARMDDVLIPFLLDGSPLPTQLGGPVRLVIPAMYAYKSVKWLQGIELIDRDHIGYWGERGYPNDAWLKKT